MPSVSSGAVDLIASRMRFEERHAVDHRVRVSGVRVGRQELSQEVAVSGMELHDLEPRLSRVVRRGAEVRHDLVEVLLGDRPGAHELPRRLDRRRRHRVPPDVGTERLPPQVRQLAGGDGSLASDRRCPGCQPGNDLGLPCFGDRAGSRRGVRRDERASHCEHRGPSCSQSSPVVVITGKWKSVSDGARGVGGPDDPVPEGQRTNLDRLVG